MALPMDIDTLKTTIGRRTGVAKSNRFSVYIPLPLISLNAGTILSNIASGNTNPMQIFNDPREISLLCETAQLPGRTIATTDYATSMKTVKQPYAYINDEVSFTFLLTGDYYIKKLFTTWQEQIVDTANKTLKFKNDYTVDAYIQQLNDQHNPIYTCRLKRAFPTSVSSIELGNSNENQIVRVTVNFAYDDWETANFAGSAVGIAANVLTNAL